MVKPSFAPVDETATTDTAPVSLKSILVAVDASDYSDRALEECAKLAHNAEGVVTGNFLAAIG